MTQGESTAESASQHKTHGNKVQARVDKTSETYLKGFHFWQTTGLEHRQPIRSADSNWIEAPLSGDNRCAQVFGGREISDYLKQSSEKSSDSTERYSENSDF